MGSCNWRRIRYGTTKQKLVEKNYNVVGGRRVGTGTHRQDIKQLVSSTRKVVQKLAVDISDKNGHPEILGLYKW